MIPSAEPIPPRIDELKPVSRARWAIHLALITLYLLVVAFVGLGREQSKHGPALSHSTGGLLLVCAVELLTFGVIFWLAWLASRASGDDLLLRWRGKGFPFLWGVLYSVGLRLALGVVVLAVAAVILLSRAMSIDGLRDFAEKNRPKVEEAVDVSAMRDNPAYYVLTLTVVSFVLAGMREELWRSSFIAGMKGVWPRQFGSTFGQICAVIIGAVVFGLGHMSMGILAALLAGFLGVGLGLIMVFHRSIWPAVLAHGFFDATSLAVLPFALEALKQLSKPH